MMRFVVQSFPLEEAVYCGNCGQVSDSKGNTCDACESVAIVNLARFLEGHMEWAVDTDA
jgi:hypothetical protein